MHVFLHLGAVHRAEKLAALFVITRITPDRGQAIGGQRHVASGGKTAGNVLHIGIEAAIFVHHQNGRQAAVAGAGRSHQVTADAAIALRRGHRDGLGADAAVVFRHLYRPGIIGLQHLEQRQRTDAAHGIFLCAFEEITPPDGAMDI